MYKLYVKHHFDAAHFLPFHEGKCSEMHGHRWEVEVQYIVHTQRCIPMIVDFADIKRHIDTYDHCTLNDHILNPTAETLAMRIARGLPKPQVECQYEIMVTVWESPECSVTYTMEVQW